MTHSRGEVVHSLELVTLVRFCHEDQDAELCTYGAMTPAVVPSRITQVASTRVLRTADHTGDEVLLLSWIAMSTPHERNG